MRKRINHPSVNGIRYAKVPNIRKSGRIVNILAEDFRPAAIVRAETALFGGLRA